MTTNKTVTLYPEGAAVAANNLISISDSIRFMQIVRHSFPEKLRNKLLQDEANNYRISRLLLASEEKQQLRSSASEQNVQQMYEQESGAKGVRKALQRRPLHCKNGIQVDGKYKTLTDKLPALPAASKVLEKCYYPYGWPIANKQPERHHHHHNHGSISSSVMSYISLPSLTGAARCSSPTTGAKPRKRVRSPVDAAETKDEQEETTSRADTESSGPVQREESAESARERAAGPDSERRDWDKNKTSDQLLADNDNISEEMDETVNRIPVRNSTTILKDVLNRSANTDNEQYELIFKQHGNKLLIDTNCYQTFARKRK